MNKEEALAAAKANPGKIIRFRDHENNPNWAWWKFWERPFVIWEGWACYPEHGLFCIEWTTSR